jgi:hypothetical protein
LLSVKILIFLVSPNFFLIIFIKGMVYAFLYSNLYMTSLI